jgi:fluoride exporter
VTRLLLVCLGSGLGGGLRYLFTLWTLRVFGPGFPFGTLGVNVVGSFLILLLTHLGLKGHVSTEMRLFLTTGVLGGLTTYSTFSYETLRLFEERGLALGLLNVAVTVLACLLAATLGLLVARWLG